MKKRKPPIVLLSILAVLFMMVISISLYSMSDLTSGGHNHDHDEHETTHTETPPNASQLPDPKKDKEAMAKSLQTVTGGPGESQGNAENKTPSKPLIAIPRPEESRPKPNNNMTSSQWYDPKYINRTK